MEIQSALYRRRAREACESARQMSLEPDREQFLVIARKWSLLAEQAEQCEQLVAAIGGDAPAPSTE